MLQSNSLAPKLHGFIKTYQNIRIVFLKTSKLYINFLTLLHSVLLNGGREWRLLSSIIKPYLQPPYGSERQRKELHLYLAWIWSGGRLSGRGRYNFQHFISMVNCLFPILHQCHHHTNPVCSYDFTLMIP